jgi:hypothetical protein
MKQNYGEPELTHTRGIHGESMIQWHIDTGIIAAEVAAAQSGEGTPELWQRFIEAWTWRKAQVEAGHIEVALESIEATADSIPPAEALQPEYLNEAYNEYRALAGWEA